MSNISHIYLNEISDKKVFEYESIEALGGSSKEFELKSFKLVFSIQDAGDGYYVSGTLKILRNFPCTVCNADADLSQNIKFDEFIRVDSSFDADSDVIAKSDESESLVLKTPVWNLLEFVRETINLEEPTQFYGHGQQSNDSCPEYLELVAKGVLLDPEAPKSASPFDTLKDFQFKS
jgi:uncharacterized metal-binding protein YceD (DUF177 family)